MARRIVEWPQQAYRVEPIELPPWYVQVAEIVAYSLAALIGVAVFFALMVSLILAGGA